MKLFVAMKVKEVIGSSGGELVLLHTIINDAHVFCAAAIAGVKR